jgi:hypothetical protein
MVLDLRNIVPADGQFDINIDIFQSDNLPQRFADGAEPSSFNHLSRRP